MSVKKKFMQATELSHWFSSKVKGGGVNFWGHNYSAINEPWCPFKFCQNERTANYFKNHGTRIETPHCNPSR